MTARKQPQPLPLPPELVEPFIRSMKEAGLKVDLIQAALKQRGIELSWIKVRDISGDRRPRKKRGADG